MKSRVLRSKAMILVSRLPLPLPFFFSSLLEFESYRPCNYDNYFYFSLMRMSSMHMLSFDGEFFPM